MTEETDSESDSKEENIDENEDSEITYTNLYSTNYDQYNDDNLILENNHGDGIILAYSENVTIVDSEIKNFGINLYKPISFSLSKD